METVIKTKHLQDWRYETDEFRGTCIIAKDDMQIKFIFESKGNEFYDVLEIDEAIDSALQKPVSVEGMTDHLVGLFPGVRVTSMGRAISHGWIRSTAQ